MTRLRRPRPEELAVLERWHAEPSSPFEDWSCDPPPRVDRRAALPPPAGAGELVVADAADAPVGTVSWRTVAYGRWPGSQALDIGISLRPEFCGRGHGSRAQRLLADYLFATTGVYRIEASTDVTNVAERCALERAGFTAEGVLRGAQWRAGAYRDLVRYARLRGDA